MERSMKKTIIAIIVALLPLLVNAQEQYADSIVYRPAAAVDSTLLGKSIFNILSAHSYGEGDIRIHQSQAITNAMKQYISGNSSRKISGYRVRIFFDNSQSARNVSESVMRTFRAAHPGTPAYRSYQNPFFRVVAGNFRTKSEAMEFLQRVKSTYPAAIVVKEDINYPAIDKQHNYVTDTVSVRRPSAYL